MLPGGTEDVVVEVNPQPHILASLLDRLSADASTAVPRWLGVFVTHNPGMLGFEGLCICLVCMYLLVS